MATSIDPKADLSTITDSELDSLRQRILIEQEARRTIATAQQQAELIAQRYRDAADRNLPPGTIPEWSPTGGIYPVGYEVTYSGKTYKVVQLHTAQGDWTPDKTPALWTVVQPAPAEPSGTPAWTAGVAYKTGDVVTFEGKNYKCVQGHTAQDGWTPTAVPSLWQAL